MDARYKYRNYTAENFFHYFLNRRGLFSRSSDYRHDLELARSKNQVLELLIELKVWTVTCKMADEKKYAENTRFYHSDPLEMIQSGLHKRTAKKSAYPHTIFKTLADFHEPIEITDWPLSKASQKIATSQPKEIAKSTHSELKDVDLGETTSTNPSVRVSYGSVASVHPEYFSTTPNNHYYSIDKPKPTP